MIEVQEMTNKEMEAVLRRVGYGHLACARDNRPYIVPIHYAYDKPNIYVYTTEGMKTDIIKDNPQVCLQIEEVVGNDDWRSIVVKAMPNKYRTEMSGGSRKANSFHKPDPDTGDQYQVDGRLGA